MFQRTEILFFLFIIFSKVKQCSFLSCCEIVLSQFEKGKNNNYCSRKGFNVLQIIGQHGVHFIS